MARRGLAFDQRDASSLSGERDGSGTACHSTTEDENFILQGVAPDSRKFHQCIAGFHISIRDEDRWTAGWLRACSQLGSEGSQLREIDHALPFDCGAW